MSKDIPYEPNPPKPQPKPQSILLAKTDTPVVKTHEPDPVTAVAIFAAFVLTLITKG